MLLASLIQIWIYKTPKTTPQKQMRFDALLFLHRPVTRRLINLFTPYNCRVTRHLISTTSRQHGGPAETEPALTIHQHKLSF